MIGFAEWMVNTLTYTALQICAVADALDIVVRALERILRGPLPLGDVHIQEAESHLCRAHASLQALLRSVGQSASTPIQQHCFADSHKGDRE
jgi:hypothetical protein